MNQSKSIWPPRVDGGSLPSIVWAQALEGELATVTRAAGRSCSRHCPHLQTPSAPPLGTHLGTSVAPYEAAHSLSYTLGGVLDSSLPVSFLVSFSQGCWLAVPCRCSPPAAAPFWGGALSAARGHILPLPLRAQVAWPWRPLVSQEDAAGCSWVRRCLWGDREGKEGEQGGRGTGGTAVGLSHCLPATLGASSHHLGGFLRRKRDAYLCKVSAERAYFQCVLYSKAQWLHDRVQQIEDSAHRATRRGLYT